MPLPFAANLVIGGLNLVIGGYVLLKNPRGIIHRSFFLFVLGIVGWSVSIVALCWTGWVWLTTLPFWSAEFMVLGFVLFAEIFPDGGALPRRFVYWLAPWLIITLLTPSDLIVRTVQFNRAGYLKPEHGPLFPVFGIVMGAYILFGIATLAFKYRGLQGIRRVQMRYAAAGAGLFLFFAFATNVVLPLFRIFQFNLLGPLFSIIFIGAAAYAIVRHQFMDIRVIIQRGLLYAFSIGILACVFFGTDFVVRQFTQLTGWGDDVVAAIVGAFGFIQLRKFFERVTDPIFFRNEYRYISAVHELGPLLNATINLEALLKTLDDFLMRTIKPERMVFVIESADENALVRTFLHGADHTETDEKKMKALAKRTGETIFFQERREDGDGRAEIAAIIPLRAHTGRVATVLLGKKLSDDIFRSKDIALLSVVAHQAGMAIENARLYERSLRYGEELEARVRERTEKIQRMQDAQSKFLTDVSHGLQTPMAVFGVNMEILMGKRKGAKKAALVVMRATLERMSGMIDHLLAAARLNFSKEKLHKTDISVDDLLEEVYHDCFMLAEDKGIVLSYASFAVRIEGDREKLKEVILNLVSNALKHTPRGGKIVLAGRTVGNAAEIGVRDTGSGISPEDLPRIFDRFYRIRASDCPGTGLGLDICKKIVEMHGGNIKVESALGKGSTFTVAVPLASGLKDEP